MSSQIRTGVSSQTLSPGLASSSSLDNEQIHTTIREMALEAVSYSNATISNISNTSTDENADQEWFRVLITVFSAAIMVRNSIRSTRLNFVIKCNLFPRQIFIIIAAIFGNLLVIISVMRVRKLR